MTEKYCKDCKHFIQHYAKVGENYITTALGHCIYPRIKSKS